MTETFCILKTNSVPLTKGKHLYSLVLYIWEKHVLSEACCLSFDASTSLEIDIRCNAHKKQISAIYQAKIFVMTHQTSQRILFHALL